MTTIPCNADNSCPYQYTCQNNLCLHQPVFPIFGYPIAIYCLYPIASAICNISGNSFGEFKVLLLMDALDYSQSEATTLSYPLILGTALYNVIRLVLKRHPYKETSIVDYNIVLIIIPCVLYGSTIGSLVNNFMPPIVADCLIVTLLTLFSTKFFIRLKGLIQKSKEEKGKELETEMEAGAKIQKSINEKDGKKQLEVELRAVDMDREPSGVKSQNIAPVIRHTPQQVLCKQTIKLGAGPQNLQGGGQLSQPRRAQTSKFYHKSLKKLVQNSIDRYNSSSSDNQQQFNQFNFSNKATLMSNKSRDPNFYQNQLQAQLEYQKSYHFPHIIAILLLFVVFESFSFLAQGKFIHFDFCSSYYALGMALLSILFIVVMFAIYIYTRNQLKYYKRINFPYEYPLNHIKYFGMICGGSFLGGFNGGVFAIGNSTTIIFTLLYLQVQPIVVSATVGFQVVFAAAASLCQAIAQNTIPLNVIIFFFVLTFVAGGILSFIVGHFVNKMERDKVNMVLVAIVACLTCASAVSMLVNIALGYINFGKEYMIAIKATC